jgi:hypothetical protein
VKRLTNSQTKSTPKTAGKPTTQLTVVRNDVEPARPDFLTWTPEDTSYVIAALTGGGSAQALDLSRHEFIKLKVELARLRGYQIPDPVDDEFLSSVEYRCLPDAA